MSKDTSVKALREAIEKASGQAALAQRLSQKTKKRITQQGVSKWFKSGVPAHWVLPLEEITGVPAYRLRPDLYRRPAA